MQWSDFFAIGNLGSASYWDWFNEKCNGKSGNLLYPHWEIEIILKNKQKQQQKSKQANKKCNKTNKKTTKQNYRNLILTGFASWILQPSLERL